METVFLKGCQVASVRADLVKNEVKITVSATLSTDIQEAVRQRLAWWSASDQIVEVSMMETAPRLPGLDGS